MICPKDYNLMNFTFLLDILMGLPSKQTVVVEHGFSYLQDVNVNFSRMGEVEPI